MKLWWTRLGAGMALGVWPSPTSVTKGMRDQPAGMGERTESLALSDAEELPPHHRLTVEGAVVARLLARVVREVVAQLRGAAEAVVEVKGGAGDVLRWGRRFSGWPRRCKLPAPHHHPALPSCPPTHEDDVASERVLAGRGLEVEGALLLDEAGGVGEVADDGREARLLAARAVPLVRLAPRRDRRMAEPRKLALRDCSREGGTGVEESVRGKEKWECAR